MSSLGVTHGACIDKATIEEIIGVELNVKKDEVQRAECQCVASVEVGAYNSCGHGCQYCYANYSPDTVNRNMMCYDPDSPILCDAIGPDDRITERPVKSLAVHQLSFL